MRRWVIWITPVCFITTQTAAVAGPFEEGTTAGQAANPVIRGRSIRRAPRAPCRATPPRRHRKPRTTASPACRVGQCPPGRLRHQHR